MTHHIVTPTGAPVKIEMWAMPEKDTAVQKLYRDYSDLRSAMAQLPCSLPPMMRLTSMTGTKLQRFLMLLTNRRL